MTQNLNLANFFLLLYLLSSQIYTFDAGSFQFSHIFFIFFSLLVIYSSFKKKIDLHLLQYFLFFIFFLLLVAITNLYYSISYNEDLFLIATLHFIIGFFITFIICCYLFYCENKDIFKNILFFSALSLFLLYILNIQGKYNYFPRYSGFFYGPGQMANWVLCIFSSYVLLYEENSKNKEKIFFFFFCLIAILMVVASGSRSAYISLPLIFFLAIINLGRVKKLFTFFFLILVLPVSYLFIDKKIIFYTYDRLFVLDIFHQLTIRGYSRIWEYPQFLLFGSGQALDERFFLENSLQNDKLLSYSFEIHSSFIAILFYYGVFALLFFILFLFRVFRHLSFLQKISFLIPFFYSLGTYNFRTPIFWVFIGVSIYASYKNYTRNSYKNYTRNSLYQT